LAGVNYLGRLANLIVANQPVRVSRANYLAFLSMRGSEVQGG